MNTLKELRKAAGLSQAQLAKKSGVDVRTIQAYESGARDMGKAQVDNVIKLADALGVPCEEIKSLIGGAE